MSSTSRNLPWHFSKGRIVIHLRVTPKSSRDAIDGLSETADGLAFRARIRAPASEGRANVALENLVASWLDVPKCQVKLISGLKSRNKSVSIAGDLNAVEQCATNTMVRFAKTNNS